MAPFFMPTFTEEDAMSDARIPSTGVAWFNPRRFDEPKPADPEVEPVEDEDPAEPEAEPEGDEDPNEDDPSDGELGPAGKRALERMKASRAAVRADRDSAKKQAAAERKAAADARKQLAELTKKVQEFEDGQKSDLEKAQAQAERSADQAAKAVARAVQSEIKASAGQFADPSDATDALMKDPSKYVDASGDIDTDAIEADLADLLERKPHWAKPAPAAEKQDPEGEPQKPGKPKPKPDPGQGSRGGPAGVDFRTASDEDFVAELARYGVRKRY